MIYPKNIFYFQNPKGQLNYAYGKIKEINKIKYEFYHLVSTNVGSSGSPIFLKDSIQVIGIHRGGISIRQKIMEYLSDQYLIILKISQ